MKTHPIRFFILFEDGSFIIRDKSLEAGRDLYELSKRNCTLVDEYGKKFIPIVHPNDVPKLNVNWFPEAGNLIDYSLLHILSN